MESEYEMSESPSLLQRRKFLSEHPKKWTSAEERRLLRMLRKGKDSWPELRKAFKDRGDASIRSKVRKLRIRHDLFGDAYREGKIQFSEKVADKTNPKTVFEAYAGAGHQTLVWANRATTVYSAERNKTQVDQFTANIAEGGFREIKQKSDKKWIWRTFQKGEREVRLFVGDAMDAAVALRYHKAKIDLIDLDTCGSTIPVLPLFLNLLRPAHLVVTHGEFLSYRFGREDVLRRVLCHLDVNGTLLPHSAEDLKKALIKADMLSALRCANETTRAWWLQESHGWWLKRKGESQLSRRTNDMFRIHYRVVRPSATADCLNELAEL